MQAAIDKALEGIQDGQSPFGASIVSNEEIVTTAHNNVWGARDITAHAEINAIRDACKKLNQVHLPNCVIYSTCEPCPMCFGAIHWARISTIYYGVSIEDAESFGFNEIRISNKQLQSLGELNIDIYPGYMRDECEAVFRKWKKSGISSKY
jgi:tRNA(Arg) A34 adenosine deaminase TadA